MKILAVADEESRSLWDFYTPDKLEGVDLSDPFRHGPAGNPT